MQRIPKCLNNINASSVCITLNCKKNPFICQLCPNKQCQKQHQNCNKSPWYNLVKNVRQNKPIINSKTQQKLKQIEKIIQNLIAQLQKIFEEYKIFRKQLEICKSYNEIIKCLDDQNYQILTGDYIAKLQQQTIKTHPSIFNIQADPQNDIVIIQQLTNKLKAKLTQMYASDQIFNWSNTLKSQTIYIQQKIVKQTKRDGQRTKTVAFLQPELRQNKIYNWSIKIIRSRVCLGVCLRKIVTQNQFGIRLDKLTHGGYMLTDGGYVWIHSSTKWIKTNFKYQEGDILNLTYNGITGNLGLQNSQGECYNIVVPKPIDDELYGFVYLWNEGIAQII